MKANGVYLEKPGETMFPYWDFNDPAIPIYVVLRCRMCFITGTFHLSAGDKGGVHKDAAMKMLKSLVRKIINAVRQARHFSASSSQTLPAKSEVDASIIYADYYYIEALLQLRLQEGRPVIG
ncbi:MAG: hypothetical protein ACLUHA_00395 [Bacteroides stercoris]